MRYLDLTQTFTGATPVYPGDAPIKLAQVASLENDGATNFALTTSMHVGTHVDGPWHMIPGGRRLVEFSPETWFGRAVVLDARGKKEIGPEVLRSAPIVRGDIVLVATGWAERYGQDNYYTDYPAVSEEFASALVAAGVKMLGLDSPSPDHPPFLIHKVLLKNEILIIENLTNVTALIGAGSCELVVAPLKIAADSAPARVLAKLT